MIDVLIVEDFVSGSDALGAFLRLNHYEVQSVRTIHQAVDVVGENRPLACIIDLMLPDGDGEDFVAAMRGLDPDCLLIVMSAYLDAPRRASLERIGVHALIEKPPRDGIRSILAMLPPPRSKSETGSKPE